jgi:hypothetical protein
MSQRTTTPDADEWEIEICDVDGVGRTGQPRPLPGPETPPAVPRPQRLLIAVMTSLLVATVVVLGLPPIRAALVRQLSLGASRPPMAALAGAGSAPVAPISPPLTLLPAPTLASPPRTCPGPPPLTTVEVPFFGPALGLAPTYVIGPRGQPLTLRLGGPDGRAYTRLGWLGQIEWALSPGALDRITVSVVRLSDGLPALLTVGPRRQPATTGVLDPQSANDGPTGPHWREWLGAVYLPGAGCYALEATWPGGSWQIPFAAGR